ncbi:MAG: hypothetical protein M5U28_37725 [Sandaracinaceae bacterium]|nr:hypothetical protein [Sandaracinaceae bacterium]
MGASTKSIRAPRDADRPTLLMVGSGDPMDVALRVALDRHGLFVEAAATDELRSTVHLTAPDLILLLGDAAEQGGVAALTLLASDATSAAVPVVLLAPDEGLESRMHAFRHGAMAVVPRTASADAVARKIASLTREMSEHFEEKTGEIGEATFDELVEIVKKELRSGILSVHAPNHKGGPMRVVLGAGRPVAQAVAEFVARLKPHVSAAGAMYYQFHTSAGGPVELLEMDGGTGDVEALARLRVLLVDDDPARADTLAQELRARGSIVFVTDTAGRGLERAVGLDPQVAIVDAAGLEGPASRWCGRCARTCAFAGRRSSSRRGTRSGRAARPCRTSRSWPRASSRCSFRSGISRSGRRAASPSTCGSSRRGPGVSCASSSRRAAPSTRRCATRRW